MDDVNNPLNWGNLKYEPRNIKAIPITKDDGSKHVRLHPEHPTTTYVFVQEPNLFVWDQLPFQARHSETGEFYRVALASPARAAFMGTDYDSMEPTHRHYKGGLYRVFGHGVILSVAAMVSVEEHKLEYYTLYKHIHPHEPAFFIRPYDLFNGAVQQGDDWVYRFEELP